MSNGTNNPCSSTKCEVKLELAFEYLMSKDRLQWVTITSQQVRLSVTISIILFHVASQTGQNNSSILRMFSA